MSLFIIAAAAVNNAMHCFDINEFNKEKVDHYEYKHEDLSLGYKEQFDVIRTVSKMDPFGRFKKKFEYSDGSVVNYEYEYGEWTIQQKSVLFTLNDDSVFKEFIPSYIWVDFEYIENQSNKVESEVAIKSTNGLSGIIETESDKIQKKDTFLGVQKLETSSGYIDACLFRTEQVGGIEGGSAIIYSWYTVGDFILLMENGKDETGNYEWSMKLKGLDK